MAILQLNLKKNPRVTPCKGPIPNFEYTRPSIINLQPPFYCILQIKLFFNDYVRPSRGKLKAME